MSGGHALRCNADMKYQEKTGSNKTSYTVRDLPKSERPREYLKEHGSEGMQNPALLAILLRTGLKGHNVIAVAHDLISAFGGLHELSKASYEDILSKKIKGLGPDKAVTLAACFELARRVRELDGEEHSVKMKGGSVTEPEKAAARIKEEIMDWSKEQFVVASFDTRNRLIGIDRATKGTLTASLVHPRETFEKAIRRHAATIIVAHNHPSGDPDPSEEDIRITKRLSEAGKIMGIELLDHIILSQDSYYSFKEKGML